jgi:hypothetical protein
MKTAARQVWAVSTFNQLIWFGLEICGTSGACLVDLTGHLLYVTRLVGQQAPNLSWEDTQIDQ